jgi:sec-independent protein translocase protein TatB
MFDVGFTELMLIGVMGLIVLGPERLPVAARTIGKWVGKIKRTVGGVQREIQEELRLDEIRKKTQANTEAVKARMDELREEAELMDAPVVAAASNQQPADNADSTAATEAPAAPAAEEDKDPYGAQPFSEPTSLDAMTAMTGSASEPAAEKEASKPS